MNVKILASGSSGNCVVLEEGGKMILLDAGIKIQDIKKGIGYRVSDILLAFVSHVHL